jgi:hypothetical protein
VAGRYLRPAFVAGRYLRPAFVAGRYLRPAFVAGRYLGPAFVAGRGRRIPGVEHSGTPGAAGQHLWAAGLGIGIDALGAVGPAWHGTPRCPPAGQRSSGRQPSPYVEEAAAQLPASPGAQARVLSAAGTSGLERPVRPHGADRPDCSWEWRSSPCRPLRQRSPAEWRLLAPWCRPPRRGLGGPHPRERRAATWSGRTAEQRGRTAEQRGGTTEQRGGTTEQRGGTTEQRGGTTQRRGPIV